MDAYKDRVQFIGDLNKHDASIQLLNAKFSDNGTYFCDVKNPPDVSGTPGRTELRVVARGDPESTGFFLLCVFLCCFFWYP